MGKLVVDGNKVYTVDEACMRRKNLTLAQVKDAQSGEKRKSGVEKCAADVKIKAEKM